MAWRGPGSLGNWRRIVDALAPAGSASGSILRALIKAAGLTPSMVRRAQFFASLTEAEFEALLARSR
jgi:hypothetical protein